LLRGVAAEVGVNDPTDSSVTYAERYLWYMSRVRRSCYVSGRTEHHYCPVTSLNCIERLRVKVSFWHDDRWWLHLHQIKPLYFRFV